MAFYLDTSALAKLVLPEPETHALRAWILARDRTLVSSDLARTELMRSVRRQAPSQAVAAGAVLDSLSLTTLSSATFTAAGLLDPAVLRSLDALHIAAALELGDDLEGMVTYDSRMTEAAAAHGIPVLAPA